MGAVEAARAIEPLCMLWCIPGFGEGDWSPTRSSCCGDRPRRRKSVPHERRRIRGIDYSVEVPPCERQP